MLKFSNKAKAAVFVLPLFLQAIIVTSAGAAPDCSALTSSPIYRAINPTIGTNLLTASQSEVESAIRLYGFTDNRGIAFYGSVKSASDLIPVYRMYNPKTNDFLWTASTGEVESAVQNYGYVKQAVNFYASSTPGNCTQPVHRFHKGYIHRFTADEAERSALVADGWVYEGVGFLGGVKVNPVNPVFSIAIMPDTQNESQPSMDGNYRELKDDRFINRTRWLAANKTSLNLRYVLHSGDVVNWGERDTYQYTVVGNGMKELETAKIPYILSVGNHDTKAVCVGGSGCPGEKTWEEVRKNPAFNTTFDGRFGGLTEPFVKAPANVVTPYGVNVNNGYSLFEAGGLKWMVLSLELWPRTEVINWAKGIVAQYPNHNVIVVTHAYLNEAGDIMTDNGGYGANSPMYLFNNLISQYKNIRFVFSGHVGGVSASRTDTGKNGNTINSFLQSIHSTRSNPVRILKIDTANDTASTYIYAPKTNEYWNRDSGAWVNTSFEEVRSNLGYVH